MYRILFSILLVDAEVTIIFAKLNSADFMAFTIECIALVHNLYALSLLEILFLSAMQCYWTAYFKTPLILQYFPGSSFFNSLLLLAASLVFCVPPVRQKLLTACIPSPVEE